jgi:hypothetical protein
MVTEATIEKAVFWDVTPYSFCKNRRFGGIHHLHAPDDGGDTSLGSVGSNNSHTA